MGGLLLCLAITFAAVTLLGLLLLACGVERSGPLVRKLLVPVFLLTAVAFLRPRRAEIPRLLGLVPRPERPIRVVLQGFLIGVVSLLVLVVGLLLAGFREVRVERDALELCLRALFYFVTTILVLGLLEETLFRGILHGRLLRAGGPRAAVLLGSVLFALAHFLKHRGDRPESGLAGVLDVAPAAVQGLTVTPERWKEVVGLFMVGLVLALIRQRTGTVYLGLGVHAGWVFVRKMDAVLTDEVSKPKGVLEFVIGTNRFYDGLLGWMALLLALFFARLFLSGEARRPSGRIMGAPADGSRRRGERP